MLKRHRTLLNVLQGLIILTWVVFLRPRMLGGPASYVVVSGVSMEPTLRSGALAVMLRSRDYAVGDIVAYRVGSGYVIHRIVGEDPEGFVVQGDNKDSSDPWKPTAEDIAGKMWFQIPGGGHIIGYLRQPMLLAPLVGTMAMMLILFPEAKQLNRRRKATHLLRQMPNPAFDFSVKPLQDTRSASPGSVPITLNQAVAIGGRSRARALFDSRAQIQPRSLQHPLPPEMEVYVVQSDSRLRWEYVMDLRSPSRMKRRR